MRTVYNLCIFIFLIQSCNSIKNVPYTLKADVGFIIQYNNQRYFYNTTEVLKNYGELHNLIQTEEGITQLLDKSTYKFTPDLGGMEGYCLIQLIYNTKKIDVMLEGKKEKAVVIPVEIMYNIAELEPIYPKLKNQKIKEYNKTDIDFHIISDSLLERYNQIRDTVSLDSKGYKRFMMQI